MGLRQRKWATETRTKLISVLGGHCFKCQTDQDLQLDCIEPCGDEHHKMEYSWRMSFYRQQYFKFNLQLLCEDCHIQKSKTEHSSNSPY